MKDIWYGDNRDLIKWSVLLHLAREYNAKKILQIAYYRKSNFKSFEIDGVNHSMPEEIINHFRRITNIETLKLEVPVHVFDTVLDDRKVYLPESLKFIKRFQNSNTVVFLDPDTGLEPKRHGLQHVLELEAKTIYDNLMRGDVFVFYQHQTNRNGRPWIEPKRKQLARALNIDLNNLKIAYGQFVAHDVAFYYCTKPQPGAGDGLGKAVPL